jgi:DinB superfamily
MTPSNSQIARLGAELDVATVHAQELLANAGAGQLMRRPRPQSWSPGECIAHLSITTRAYLPLLDRAIANARTNGMLANGPFRMDMMGRFLKWSLEPPPRFHFRTGEAFEPLTAAEPAEILPEFVSFQQQLIQ